MAKVGEIMCRDVQTCSVGDTLATAAKMMWDCDIGCVPVVDGEGRPVGILTDRDACMAAYTQGMALWQIRVESVMSRELYTCAPDDLLATAETLMKEHQVRRLPVVDGGRIVGVLAMSDLARSAEARKGRKPNGVSADDVRSTLAAICQPRSTPIVPASV